MDLFLSIIAFLIIFSLVVLIHELGHFVMAIRAGIKVEEFGIGLPPRIYGIKRKGIIWSINAIPFGGFVRMLGEDMSEKDASTSKRSFINKTSWQKIQVLVAGVFMNFVLAFVLLTIGFIVGIEPLIVTEDDFLNNIRQGNIEYQNDILVKEVVKDSIADKQGVLPNDKIVKISAVLADLKVYQDDINMIIIKDALFKGILNIRIDRDGEILERAFALDNQKLGIKIYPVIDMPRVVIKDVKGMSFSDMAGLKSGDIIVSANNQMIFSTQELKDLISNTKDKIDYLILRNNKTFLVTVPSPISSKTVISKVLTGLFAESVGFQPMDQILAINDKSVFLPQDVKEIISSRAGKPVSYKVSRNGEIKILSGTVPSDGMIGVYLAEIFSYNDYDLSIYDSSVLSSIVKIKDIKYPFYVAPFKVFSEIKRLSILTVQMFSQLLQKIIGEGQVPNGVAGPVGIARMTYTFVQEGFRSLLRFTALISLSLGVINILPLPALDGGRLFFVIIEGFIGKKMKPHLEAKIHTIGFIFFILLILFVTFNDIKMMIMG